MQHCKITSITHKRHDSFEHTKVYPASIIIDRVTNCQEFQQLLSFGRNVGMGF